MADAESLHSNLTGYDRVIMARSTEEKKPQLEEMMANHCDNCHTSCGQCHVSRPDYVNGGFLARHAFQKTPPMETTCASCHGGRIFISPEG